MRRSQSRDRPAFLIDQHRRLSVVHAIAKRRNECAHLVAIGDLERAEAAELYGRIGALGRLFIAIESEAFALPS